MILVLFGPPGSGKGTQAKRLIRDMNLTHLSTGDMLREAARDETELGRKAKTLMDSGELVPDALIIDMISEKISSKNQAGGFIFDGFPRNLAQAEKLDKIFSDIGKTVDRALLLDVPDEELVKRLSGRFYCPKCNAGYNYPLSLPKTEGVCDNDGEKILRRTDDKEETVRKRLTVYHSQTSPLREYYQKKNKLSVIDANNGPDTVSVLIKAALEPFTRQAEKA